MATRVPKSVNITTFKQPSAMSAYMEITAQAVTQHLVSLATIAIVMVCRRIPKNVLRVTSAKKVATTNDLVSLMLT